MTVLRWVWLVVAVGGVAATGSVLGWPGWSWAPAAALAVAAVLAAVDIGRRRPPGRSDIVSYAVSVVAVVATAVTAFAVPDTRDGGDRGPDRAVLTSASEILTTLFDFTPADFAPDAAQRRSAALTTELTGRLLTDYRSQGPNVVLASAVESGASSELSISSVGVAEATPERMRLLVFAAQTITLPTADPPRATVPIARWAVMRRVDGSWRLADLYPVGLNG